MSAKPILIPFEPFHVEHFRPGSIDKLAMNGHDLRKLSDNWNGNAVSAIQDGKVIGIAGIGMDGDTAVAWLFLSDEIRKMPVFLYRTVKNGLIQLTEKLGLRTLDAFVVNGFMSGIKFAEALGFQVIEWDSHYIRLRKQCQSEQ